MIGSDNGNGLRQAHKLDMPQSRSAAFCLRFVCFRDAIPCRILHYAPSLPHLSPARKVNMNIRMQDHVTCPRQYLNTEVCRLLVCRVVSCTSYLHHYVYIHTYMCLPNGIIFWKHTTQWWIGSLAQCSEGGAALAIAIFFPHSIQQPPHW